MVYESLLPGLLNCTLQGLFINMMTALFTGIGVNRTLAGRKYVLPAPFPASSRIFLSQRKRKINITESFRQITVMQ
ncbi:MAG: hypothetical protein MRJ52_12005 [Nitrosomonas sp.]|nr:hypothetical protein [Nitrosomonas sp.]